MRTSAYQYRVADLIFRSPQWDSDSMMQASRAIRDAMPSHLQTGWDLIQRHQCNRSTEAVCEQTTRWMAANADAIGVRIPNATERIRAMGLQGWVEHLGLSEY